MRCRLFFFVFILGLVLSVAPASGAPITFTMSITKGANTFFGEPDSVLSLSIGSDVSLAMLVDVLSPRLFQLTATGTSGRGIWPKTK